MDCFQLLTCVCGHVGQAYSLPVHIASLCYRLFAAVPTELATGMCTAFLLDFRWRGLYHFITLLLCPSFVGTRLSGVMVPFFWKLEVCAEHFVHTQHCDHSVVIPALAHRARIGTQHGTFVGPGGWKEVPGEVVWRGYKPRLLGKGLCP